MKSNRGSRRWQAARHRDRPSSGGCLIRMFVRLKSTKIKLCLTVLNDKNTLSSRTGLKQKFRPGIWHHPRTLLTQITKCQFYRLTVCVVWGLWLPIFGYCFILPLSFLFFLKRHRQLFSALKAKLIFICVGIGKIHIHLNKTIYLLSIHRLIFICQCQCSSISLEFRGGRTLNCQTCN